ncbi:NADH/NAD(+) kinase [Nakaseomyces bracarensis]|uniref:NADH/NAD(+) kinase n=1 Tax=Nakaseomyces bracarensis TaxID=273131 RepID=UPI00387199CF
MEKERLSDPFERSDSAVSSSGSESAPGAGSVYPNAINHDLHNNHYNDRISIADLKSVENMVRKLSTDSLPRSRASKTHFHYATTAYDVRMISKDIVKRKVDLDVEKIMIICKIDDASVLFLMRELVEWLLTHYPFLVVYVQDDFQSSKLFDAEEIFKELKCRKNRLKYWNPDFVRDNDVFFDLVVTMGGDGTVLFASHLFQKHVPPTLPFSLGSLGFLTNFNFEHFKEQLPTILNSKIKTNLRMRLQCKIYRRQTVETDSKTGRKVCYMKLESEHHVLNELTIDRGPSPFISMLELYSDEDLMTVAQADGIIVATPTGSTAYSLSAGGSLINPGVDAIAVTPICPHTLNFRPIILPDSIELKIKVSPNSRGTAWIAFDGRPKIELHRGDFVTVSSSPYPFPTVEASPRDFVDSISRTLGWNAREKQKSLSHVLSLKNQEKLENESTKNKRELESEEPEEEVLLDELGQVTARHTVKPIELDEPNKRQRGPPSTSFPGVSPGRRKSAGFTL